jgi:ATP-dependent helicase HrpB
VLPIYDVVEDIRDALRRSTTCILEAPPGAGKTTIVPLELRNESWLDGRRIIVVEPRRIAAKAAARRMSALLNQEVGGTVGYRMRMETCVGKNTQIEVVTEGILTRRLTRDPELDGVGLVIFDEVHERSLQADTGLAFVQMTRSLLRPDLKLVVMSATLSSLDFSEVLPDAITVKSHGRMYPVEISYAQRTLERTLPQEMAAAVERAVAKHEGDVLCFLPGFGEQRATKDLLDAHTESLGNPEILLLHGNLTTEEQDRALRPAGARRRIVLSSAIAETSVTIDGVRVVIDGGYSREPRFDARSGLSHLTTVRVSKDAAEQRSGRAGRTAPGMCMRLWTLQDHEQLPLRRSPEILTSDLSSMVLEAAAIGLDPSTLPWIDQPPASALSQAQELLQMLHALNADGRITDRGHRMLRHGAHPRVASMLVMADEFSLSTTTAASLAAILGERDILKASNDRDVRRRLDVLGGAFDAHADKGGVAAARKRRDHFRLARGSQETNEDTGALIALAYPDRVAINKGGGRFLMRNGRTVSIDQSDVLSKHEWLAIAELEGSLTNARVALAAPVDRASVLMIFHDDVTSVQQAGWLDKEQKIVAREIDMLGSILIASRDSMSIGADEAQQAFTALVKSKGLEILSWTPAATRLRQRAQFTALHGCAELPDWSDEGLLESLEIWFAPNCGRCRTMNDLRKLSVEELLRQSLSFAQLSSINRAAPDTYKPLKGREVFIDYTNPEQPTVAARLQFMFGVRTNPKIANGNVPLTIELLSPADRPLQKTTDIGGFWKGSYSAVRKEMKGRYPKHDWPENP